MGSVKESLRQAVKPQLLHRLGVLAGVRAPAPAGFVRYASELRDAGAEGAEYRAVFPAETVPLALPDTAGDPIPEEFIGAARGEYPETFLLRLRGGKVLRHAVLTADARVIGDLSVEAHATPEEVEQHSAFRFRSLPPYRHIEGRVVCLVNAYAANYYHWLFEVVPRLELARRHAADAGWTADRFLFNLVTQRFQRDTLEHLGVRDAVITDDGNFSADEMLVPCRPGNMGDPPGWACRYAREALIGLAAAAGGGEAGGHGGPVRLYVTRRRAGSRGVANEAEVMEILAPLGFTLVETEGMGLAEQVALFSRAEAVVGPHGAGLANLLFCPPGARIVELFPPQRTTHCYWSAARQLGHGYCLVLGEQQSAEDAAREAVIVDAAKLRAALRRVGLDR